MYKIHGSGQSSVLAVCDKEVLGKTFKQENIELFVSEFFFGGEQLTEEDFREKLREFGNINIVGNKAVRIALEEELVLEENIIEIQNIKHVQIFKI